MDLGAELPEGVQAHGGRGGGLPLLPAGGPRRRGPLRPLPVLHGERRGHLPADRPPTHQRHAAGGPRPLPLRRHALHRQLRQLQPEVRGRRHDRLHAVPPLHSLPPG